ncbi:SMP-30/gluconolactonase/LRE family protein [Octadecabacter sp. 1_MG-2023]|uniref:SMP-30/gluconolactonase/LRE family protein n=1 Tax=unclassified Octadecabacter TaxID=196158 RepID=UPI001C09A826|nr:MULTISPECIES: SMP-30/gluconolactonase/LRE family protein [unclassified Octadecabacter]MBU2994617.1 SMP-30/gluconolactonase/LRE family protein [Octadecabacter sp. B2R22]MDO6734090.1 SMP-30/gluconolactonase/LRE family protein [Octadecabacter sp. 1_MG-2023]
MTATVYDPRPCSLGEGPLWHPERGQLFWFDINNKRLLSRVDDVEMVWRFDHHVSAAGWIDHDTLLIASDIELFEFDIETGTSKPRCPLEPENPLTRSNDGRADPWGGFWIGTMGKQAQPKAGAIYRWYNGELRTLFDGLTIPNAICFSPDREFAYFTDTPTRQIMRQPLGADGWPDGKPSLHVDLTPQGRNPDGAVVDADGNLWNAQWGASRVTCYDKQGREMLHVDMPAEQVSCPAFGGTDFTTLFATTAAEGMHAPSDTQGQTFFTQLGQKGQPEHRVILT